MRYGRNLKAGLSCIGLVTVSARAQGVVVPMLDAASFVQYFPWKRPVLDALNADMERVPLSEARKGDVVLFHIWSPGHPLIEHCGLISGENPLTVIHSTPSPSNQVCEHPLDAPMYEPYPTPWRQFVVGVYRFREARS
jgi:hypothetical protein